MIDLFEFHAAWPGAGGGAGGAELVFIETAEAFYPLHELRGEGTAQAGIAVIAVKRVQAGDDVCLFCLHERRRRAVPLPVTFRIVERGAAAE